MHLSCFEFMDHNSESLPDDLKRKVRAEIQERGEEYEHAMKGVLNYGELGVRGGLLVAGSELVHLATSYRQEGYTLLAKPPPPQLIVKNPPTTNVPKPKGPPEHQRQKRVHDTGNPWDCMTKAKRTTFAPAEELVSIAIAKIKCFLCVCMTGFCGENNNTSLVILFPNLF